LCKCIDQIINQVYKNIEIILVNDGSLDNSGYICDQYAIIDKRVVTIHKKNNGVSAARNTGLDVCKGEYICFVDADDYLDPNMILDNVNYIEKESADVVCFNYCEDYGAQKKYIEEYKSYFTNVEIITTFFEDKSSRAVWNKFYRRYLWSTIRFPENMPFAEDWFVLSHICLYATKIVALEKIYYFYNLYNVSSICHQVNEKYYYYDYLCNRQQLLLLENEMGKFPEYIRFWHDIVHIKTFKRCLKAYKFCLLSSKFNLEQKQELKNFLLGNRSCIKKLNLKELLSYLILSYAPLLYRMRIYRKKLSHKIRSYLKNNI